MFGCSPDFSYLCTMKQSSTQIKTPGFADNQKQEVMSTLVLLGEPFTGATKFKVGDTLKDAKFPSKERYTILSIEVQQVSPFHTVVVYCMVTEKGQPTDGLQEIMEAPGRFEAVSHNDTLANMFATLCDNVRTGKLTRLA